jgi:hypothetical protein
LQQLRCTTAGACGLGLLGPAADKQLQHGSSTAAPRLEPPADPASRQLPYAGCAPATWPTKMHHAAAAASNLTVATCCTQPPHSSQRYASSRHSYRQLLVSNNALPIQVSTAIYGKQPRMRVAAPAHPSHLALHHPAPPCTPTLQPPTGTRRALHEPCTGTCTCSSTDSCRPGRPSRCKRPGGHA